MKRKKKAIYYYRRLAVLIWFVIDVIIAITGFGLIFGSIFGIVTASTCYAGIRTLCMAAVCMLLDQFQFEELFPKKKQ